MSEDNRQELTQERLKTLLHYDPASAHDTKEAASAAYAAASEANDNEAAVAAA